jgi:plastocyanin
MIPRIPQHLGGYFFLRLTRHPIYGRFSAIYDIRETIKETSGADLLAGSQVFDVAVGPVGNKLRFVPDTLNISVGDTVRWTWGSDNHSVTSGTSCTADEPFCSPDNMNCDTGILSNTGFV